MIEQDLNRQIIDLEKKLQEEKFSWNEKLRQKEKENFDIRQEYNARKSELSNTVDNLKRELSELRQLRDAEITRRSEEFDQRISEKEERISQLIREKNEIIEKNRLNSE